MTIQDLIAIADEADREERQRKNDAAQKRILEARAAMAAALPDDVAKALGLDLGACELYTNSVVCESTIEIGSHPVSVLMSAGRYGLDYCKVLLTIGETRTVRLDNMASEEAKAEIGRMLRKILEEAKNERK